MLLEVEDETRDFVTIYKKDFPSKKSRKPKEHRPQAEYRPPLNILNGPYRKCLNTRRINVTLPLNEQSEDPGETLNRIREEHSHLKGSLPKDVPDEDLVERKDNELKQTIYQFDYSKDDYSPRMEIFGRRKDVSLPKDWIISETIQRKSYRNPWKIVPESLLHVKKAIKPSDNLIPSEKEREILRIRTGDSEYDATIDATGNRVIKECLLGPPLPVEPQIYTKESDSSPSECSEILAGKKFVLPSNIF
ncbi:PREDICTED: uncharacterized protein LOC108546909 [Eufriesea mexicana]|uniref:uncharacterized protein LOC108546909 n=1 Tax=Eufriesea mexicana TaxID=516756 RepID=UPI00083C72B8|nr:PREDICTED: uncharacterized protein LOC108546909 [Eufriesea mexicana]